jgi:hypothetical protein
LPSFFNGYLWWGSRQGCRSQPLLRDLFTVIIWFHVEYAVRIWITKFQLII